MAYKVPSVDDVVSAAKASSKADASGDNRERAVSWLSEYRDQACNWVIRQVVAVLEEGRAPMATVDSEMIAAGIVREHVSFDEVEDAAVFPIPLTDLDTDRFRASCAASIMHDVARSFEEGGYLAYVDYDKLDVYLPSQTGRTLQGAHAAATSDSADSDAQGAGDRA